MSSEAKTVLFVSPRYPNLSIPIHGGGPLQLADGRYVDSKARYAVFKPGPMGGELRTSDANVIASLREKDGADHSFQEVTDEADIPAFIELRATVVEDKGPDVYRGARTSAPARAAAPEPVKAAAPAPRGRPKASAARVPNQDEA